MKNRILPSRAKPVEERDNRLSWYGRKKKFAGVLFTLPALIFIFTFMLYPLVYSFYISLFKYNFVYDRTPKFVGLGNYIQAFNDSAFLISLKHTFVFAFFYVLIIMVASLILALLIFQKIKFNGIYRTAIFLPIVVPLSLSSLAFLWILHQNYGLLNHILGDVLGLKSLTYPWLNNGTTAMGSIIGVALWATIGFETILFLGGLQAIPRDILEAAEVDGANGFRRLLYIILPNLRETYILTGIWAVLHGLKVFVEPMVMTDGGPGDSTTVLYQQIYLTAFTYFDMGYASAMAYILAAVALIFSALNYLVNRTKES
ncbi:MAG: carbohydrate ABC transporter permease [Desulfitobacteriaceae bacterium]